MKEKILKVTDRIVTILTCVLLIALIACIAILPIAKSKSYYMSQHKKNDIVTELQEWSFTGNIYVQKDADNNTYTYCWPEDYVVTWELVEEATEHIINYLYYEDVESMQFQVETSSGSVDFFTNQAIVHMEDVKVLFIGGIKLCYISIVLFILGCVYLYFRRNYVKKYLVKTYIISVISFAIVVILIAAFAAMDFSTAFEIFHYIIFPDTDKAVLAITFYSYDTLTNILTGEFFMNIGLTIGIIFISLLVLSVVICKLVQKYLPKILSSYQKESKEN